MTTRRSWRSSHATTMSDIHRLPEIDKVEREASAWIARLNADDASADDRARFEIWRRTHSLHGRVFEELSQTWRVFTDAGPLVRAVTTGQELGAVPPPPPVRRRWTLAAASALVAFALGAWWWAGTVTPRTLFQTAIGERATVTLPDGSSLDLNSNSLARVDYDERMRVIHLPRGEAFFRVRHDGSRPFWVVARDSWVRAVGTAFNVYVRPDSVRVTVSEGVVNVAAASADESAPSDRQLASVPVSVLRAGQQVDVTRGASEVRSLRPIELTRVAAWRSGTLYFENEKLSDVVLELGRYTTLEIVIESDELRDMLIGGTFEGGPRGAETLLSMLEDGFELQVRRDARRAYIARPQ